MEWLRDVVVVMEGTELVGTAVAGGLRGDLFGTVVVVVVVFREEYLVGQILGVAGMVSGFVRCIFLGAVVVGFGFLGVDFMGVAVVPFGFSRGGFFGVLVGGGFGFLRGGISSVCVCKAFGFLKEKHRRSQSRD